MVLLLQIGLPLRSEASDQETNDLAKGRRQGQAGGDICAGENTGTSARPEGGLKRLDAPVTAERLMTAVRA